MNIIPLPVIVTENGVKPMEASGCAFACIDEVEYLFIVSDNGYLCRWDQGESWKFQKISVTDPEALAMTRVGTLLIGSESGIVYEYRLLPSDQEELVEPTGRKWVLNEIASRHTKNNGMEGMAYVDPHEDDNLGYLLVGTQESQGQWLYWLFPNGGDQRSLCYVLCPTDRKVADLHSVSSDSLIVLIDDHHQGRYESAVMMIAPRSREILFVRLLPYAGAEGIAVSPMTGKVAVVIDQNEDQIWQNGLKQNTLTWNELKRNVLITWESLEKLKRETVPPKKKKGWGRSN